MGCPTLLDFFYLGYIKGLTNLNLDFRMNNISDISALSGLVQPDILRILTTTISRIYRLLNGSTNLTNLGLSNNNISDISALSGLINLTHLSSAHNNISDISALSGLSNLTYLDFSNNNISDISVLKGLTNLIDLDFRMNNISDISPLVANAGLGDGGTISLEGNPLSAESRGSHIPALQNKGVMVHY